MIDNVNNNPPFCDQIPKKTKIKKILPKQLPSGSLENGTLIIDDSVTDEQLNNIRLKD